MGETRRMPTTRDQEHHEHWWPSCTPSVVSQRLHLDGSSHHQVSMERVQILNWKDDQTTGGIKEFLYIIMLHPDLSANGARLHLLRDNPLEMCEHLVKPSR